MDSKLPVGNSSIIPTELTGKLPRSTSATGNGIQAAVMTTILLALGAGMILWAGWHEAQRMETRIALHRDGRETSGEITRLWSPGRSSKTLVGYSFDVDGRVFAGKAEVPDQFYDGLTNSRSLSIRYLPADPSVSHPAAWEWDASSDWDWFLAPVIFLMPAMAMLFTIHTGRRLVSEGLPAVAVITACVPRTGRQGFMVKYEFQAADGSGVQGRGYYENRQEVGARICVLYLQKNPKRNSQYPFLNYRVVQ